MRGKNQYGFSVLRVAAVGVIVVVLAVAGWYVWRRQADHSTASGSNEVATERTTGNAGIDDIADSVVSYCPADAKSFCKVYAARYQYGVSYPAGWNSVAEEANRYTYDGAKSLYSIMLIQHEDTYARVDVYHAGRQAIASAVKSAIAGKSDPKVSSTDITVNGHPATRLDYTGGVSYADGKVQLSAYLIESKGYTYLFDLLLRQDTPRLSAATSQKIFDSLELP